jgi:hypothetical protein
MKGGAGIPSPAAFPIAKFVLRSLEAVRVHHFEQLVIVAIVDMYADENRTVAIVDCVPQSRADLIGGSDHHSLGTKSLGILEGLRH